jgi:hypothetical protein
VAFGAMISLAQPQQPDLSQIAKAYMTVLSQLVHRCPWGEGI